MKIYMKYIDIWRILKVIKISKISGCRTFLQKINGGISLNVFHLLRKLHCDTLNAVVSFLLTTGTQHRSRRHARSFPPIHPCNLCAGGKGTVTYWDKCWCSYRGGYWRIQKRVVSRICVTIRRCYRWGCGEEHYVYYVYCSQYVCERPTYRPHPYYGRNLPIA